MYLRHLSIEYRSILSADMSADTRSICRPTLDRHIDRHQPTRMSADTRPPPGRNCTDSQPTPRSFAQLSLLSSIFSTQLRGAFSGRRPFLAFNSGSIHVFFPAMFFPRHLFLYTTLVTYGSSSFWGLLLTEVRYFRVAKTDIKS